MSDKIWANFGAADAHRKLGDKKSCIEKFKEFILLSGPVDEVAGSDSFNISIRNPLYFSHNSDLEALEEYMPGFAPDSDVLLASFDNFFGDNEIVRNIAEKASDIHLIRGFFHFAV